MSMHLTHTVSDNIFVGFGFIKIAHSATYPAIDPIKAFLTGEIVFITGASKGVGRQTAISYAKAGASVVIGARSDLTSLETELHSVSQAAGRNTTKVLKIKLDVLDQSSVDEAAKQIKNEFGHLDILINNAGYPSTFLPVADTEPLDWWQNMEVNVRGVHWMTHACPPLLLKGGDKTVINLTSISALALTPGASGYQTSKFAVIRFTEYLCVEYADRGLLAYSIHPGGVATELALKMPKQIHSVLSTDPGLAGDVLVSLTSPRKVWLAGRYIDITWDLPEFYARQDEVVKEDKLKLQMGF